MRKPYCRHYFHHLRAQLTEAEVGSDDALDEVFEHDTYSAADPSTSAVMTSLPEARCLCYSFVDIAPNNET
jgi:hypothetical protein